MQYIKCDVSTICIGMAASMDHSYCQAERKGKDMPFRMQRYDSPAIRRSTGQATEIQIAAEHILKTRQKLNTILAENTGQSLEKIQADTERDNFMSAQEAKEYGLVDESDCQRLM